MRLVRIKKQSCHSNQEVDFLTVEREGFKSGYHFPSIFREDPRNNIPIVQEILRELTFRSTNDIGGVYYEGLRFCVFNYSGMMNDEQYQNAFGIGQARTLMNTIKENKHIAFTVGLKIAGEGGWQAMINDNGNNPTTASMEINRQLKDAIIDRQPSSQALTVNNNRYESNVFPQHGLAHATNYGLTVMAVYANKVPKSIAQLDFYDFILFWRKYYTPHSIYTWTGTENYRIDTFASIPSPDNDMLAEKLKQKINTNNGQVYKHSFISTYITHHRIYGGFGSKNACINSMLTMDSHPILAIHALYTLALRQRQLCTYPIWLHLPFRPLFIIMIQIWQRKTGRSLKEAPASYKDILTVEENKKILENVLEKEYILKFAKGSIKAGHDCTVLKLCGQGKFSSTNLEAVLQGAYANARLYACRFYASNGVIGNIFNYSLHNLINTQQAKLTSDAYKKYFAYVPKDRHDEIVSEIQSIINASNNNSDIDDLINTEMYYLIEKLPDPSEYTKCR